MGFLGLYIKKGFPGYNIIDMGFLGLYIKMGSPGVLGNPAKI